MSRLPRTTKDDSADPGFAWTCLLSGAVTFEDFKIWAEHVVAETPIDALPPHMFDLMMAETQADVSAGLHKITGFWPRDPLLEKSGPADAVCDITALRGRHRPDDAGTDAKGSVSRLHRHPEVLDRFAQVFPFLTAPEIA